MQASTFAPIILSLIASPQPNIEFVDQTAPVTPAVAQLDLESSSIPQILAKADDESIILKLSDDGKFPYEQIQDEQPKYSNLFALTDYVLGSKSPVIHRMYDGESKEQAQRTLGSTASNAKASLKYKDISDTEVSQGLSMLFESDSNDLLPEELTIDEKAFFTRVLFEAKKGQIDDELINAVELLKEKPLADSQQREFQRLSEDLNQVVA